MTEITEVDYQQAAENGISRHCLRNRIRKLKWSKERAIGEAINTNEESIKRAAAATPIRKTMQLHFRRERFR